MLHCSETNYRLTCISLIQCNVHNFIYMVEVYGWSHPGLKENPVTSFRYFYGRINLITESPGRILTWRKSGYLISCPQRERQSARNFDRKSNLESALFYLSLFVLVSKQWQKMRTLEEVRATLEIAKLKEEDLQPTVRCLSFGENVSSADYCLMELDDSLCTLVEAGDTWAAQTVDKCD